MSIKYLLEEHQKIYSWKYNNCQNIYMNQYPYVVSVNNAISSFKLKDIEKFVLEITNNTSLESAKAFDILSNTLTSSYERDLSHLAIKYYYDLGIHNNNLTQYGDRLVFLILKKYKSDKSLNEVRVGFKKSVFEWIANKDNHAHLAYIVKFDEFLSDEEKQTLSKSLISSAQDFFSNLALEDIRNKSFIYLLYFDHAVKLLSKDKHDTIRREKIDVLNMLISKEKDLYFKIDFSEQALVQLKILYKNDKNIEKEIIQMDKNIKALRLKWADESMCSIPFLDNNPELKNSLEAELENQLDKFENDVNSSKDIGESIYMFICKKLPSYSDLVDRVGKASENSLNRLIATKKVIQKDGGLIAVNKPTKHDSYETSCQYDLEVNIYYLSYLPKIFHIIKEKYSIDEILEYVSFVCDKSLIIFPKRKQQWINCLINGFKGDFDISIGVVKQLENIVREILLEQDISICKPDFYSPLGFGSLLSKKELDDILDKDCLGVLRWLFQNIFGPSLRNADAHGNLDDVDYDSGIMFFIWWFALRWCVLAIPR